MCTSIAPLLQPLRAPGFSFQPPTGALTAPCTLLVLRFSFSLIRCIMFRHHVLSPCIKKKHRCSRLSLPRPASTAQFPQRDGPYDALDAASFVACSGALLVCPPNLLRTGHSADEKQGAALCRFFYYKAPGWRQKNNGDTESNSLSQCVRVRLLVACAWIYMYKVC